MPEARVEWRRDGVRATWRHRPMATPEWWEWLSMSGALALAAALLFSLHRPADAAFWFGIYTACLVVPSLSWAFLAWRSGDVRPSVLDVDMRGLYLEGPDERARGIGWHEVEEVTATPRGVLVGLRGGDILTLPPAPDTAEFGAVFEQAEAHFIDPRIC